MQEKEHCCPTLTRLSGAKQARGGFFDVAPGGSKIKKNRPWGRQRVDSSAPSDRRVFPFWPGGSQGAASRARTSEQKTTEEQLVQDLTRHGPLARRIS